MDVGGWIKMRASLINNPRVLKMTKRLSKSRAFREWIVEGGGDLQIKQIARYSALRRVTLGGLLVLWSLAREYGKFEHDDLLLSGLEISDLDELAEVPGIGDAMETVGWAVHDADRDCVILPNFKEFNVPLTNAERQKKHRQRQKQAEETTVTQNEIPVTARNVSRYQERERERERESDIGARIKKRATVNKSAAACFKKLSALDFKTNDLDKPERLAEIFKIVTGGTRPALKKSEDNLLWIFAVAEHCLQGARRKKSPVKNPFGVFVSIVKSGECEITNAQSDKARAKMKNLSHELADELSNLIKGKA